MRGNIHQWEPWSDTEEQKELVRQVLEKENGFGWDNNEKRKTYQMMGAWTLDYCWTELCRRTGNRKSRTINHKNGWVPIPNELYKKIPIPRGAEGVFTRQSNAEHVGNFWECLGTASLIQAEGMNYGCLRNIIASVVVAEKESNYMQYEWGGEGFDRKLTEATGRWPYGSRS